MTELCERVMLEVKEGYIKACKLLPEAIIKAFERAKEREESFLAKAVFEVLIENSRIAKEEGLPLCQDTGVPVVWVRIGEGVRVGDIEKAINKGLALAQKEGYIRASVCDPFTRKNTGTNTPAIIHYEIVPEYILEIELLPKGCGSENMSALAMLSPSAGIEGVKNFVIETVKKAGPNPCPPIIVGVGIGGDFEKSAILAKKALLREIGILNPDSEIAQLEKELLERINKLGIGPLGFKGKTTCLAVHIETHPCHIASLPVAVNIQCHCARVFKIKIL